MTNVEGAKALELEVLIAPGAVSVGQLEVAYSWGREWKAWPAQSNSVRREGRRSVASHANGAAWRAPSQSEVVACYGDQSPGLHTS